MSNDIELIECPKCGVVDEVGINFKHDSECSMLCSIEGCDTIAIIDAYIGSENELVLTPLCRYHKDTHSDKIIMLHEIKSPSWLDRVEE
jgi:hypothetical protein